MWEPRKSVLLRFGDDDPAHLRALGAGDRPFHALFLKTFLSEARAVLYALAEDLNRANPPGLPACEMDIDANNFASTGEAMIGDDGQVQLRISLGFCLALDEALLAYLAQPGVFMKPFDGNNPAETPDSFVDAATYAEQYRAKAFLDYAHLSGRSFDQADVTWEFPMIGWRLRQQDFLFKTALRWAMLHELAHAGLCHLHLLEHLYDVPDARLHMSETSFELSEKAASRVGWQSFGVDGPPFEPFRFSNVVKVMELHADVAALWLSIDLAKNSACHGARLFTDLAEDLQSLNAPRELAYTEMHTDRVCHYLLFSSLICVGLFEFARLHEADGPSDSHPLPEARLINLANYVFYGSDLAEPAPNGGYWINMPSHYKSDDWPDSPWNRFLNDAMAAAAQDFSQLCNLIGLDLHLFRTREQIDETNPDTLMEKEPLLNAWFQDAMSLHNIPLAAHYDVPHEFRPKSSGGAEIKTLFDYHEPVEVLTESLQKRTNGAVLSFALS